MGNKNYQSIDDIPEYNQFADYIIEYILNIRYGLRGFTRPFQINHKMFNATFLRLAPDNFDPFTVNCWDKLMRSLNLHCTAQYTRGVFYNEDTWAITIDNLDKNWSNLDKLANYVLIYCKGVFWSRNSSDLVSCFLPDLISPYPWFDVKNVDHMKSLFNSVSKIGQYRSVPYTLQLFETLVGDKVCASYPELEQVEGSN